MVLLFFQKKVWEMDSYVAVPGRIIPLHISIVLLCLKHRTSVKDRVHMHCVDAQILDMSMQHV